MKHEQDEDTMTAHRGATRKHSKELFVEACTVFPDGTTRATISRDPIPTYMARGEGAYVYDVDGTRFLDLNNNFTALIHGHAFKPVIAAVSRQLENGCCFANPTASEIALARLICERVPCLERIRFVNSGTEAVMFAIKAARAFTGRAAIAKIEGAYHGAYDWVEVAQASTPANWGEAAMPAATPYYEGVPTEVLNQVVPLPFNDPENSVKLVVKNAAKLAAIVIDPMPSRAGLIMPTPEFIAAIQDVARKHGILIISDEVLNFRQGYAGASARYGLEPDLFALGKIIGGGFPIGAIGGRAEVMQVFSAEHGRARLPQGGTFSANPISMTAGYETMKALTRETFAQLDQFGDELRHRLKLIIETRDAPMSITGAASLISIHPRLTPPRNFRDAYLTTKEATVMREMTRYFDRNGVILPFNAAASLSTPMGANEMSLIFDTFENFIIDNSDLVHTLR